jgi:hypothetical protein
MSIRKNGYTYIYLGIFDFKCFKSHLRLQVQTLCYPNLVLSVNFGRIGFIKSTLGPQGRAAAPGPRGQGVPPLRRFLPGIDFMNPCFGRKLFGQMFDMKFQ